MTKLSEKPPDLMLENTVGIKKPIKIIFSQENEERNQEQAEKQQRELINRKLKEKLPVRENYCIWDAIVAWRDHILGSSFLRITKRNYLSRMQKLIELSIINPALKLNSVDESWLKECLDKIDEISSDSKVTKVSKVTCLNSFYQFAQTFDPDYTDEYERLRYGYIPSPHEIKHRLVLSSAQEMLLANGLDIPKLFWKIRENNERDAWIIALMLETGCTLDEILNIKKEDISPTYIRIKNFQYAVPLSLIECVKTLFKDYSEYVFTTSKGNRVRRLQVNRNLKKAGCEIGLPFDLTPMIFHRFINSILLRDKRSVWEKYLCE